MRGGAADYEHRRRSRFGGWFDKYYIGDTREGGRFARYQGQPDRWDMGGKVQQAGANEAADIRHWDVAPPPEYFNELARVSKAQIIWGGNYFDLPPTRCFLVWRKLNIPLEGFSMAPVEYAWTSFNANAAMCEYFSSAVTGGEERFHPTQKPIDLYRWIYARYAKPGYKILDTHLGSGSSRIAAYEAGLDFVGCEIDEHYFTEQEKRFERHTAQMSLFVPE